MTTTKHYLSLKEVAERLGVTPGTLTRYALPTPTVMIGATRGWTPAAIDAWDAARPGRGFRPRPHADGEDHTWEQVRSGGLRCKVCGATRQTLS